MAFGKNKGMSVLASQKRGKARGVHIEPQKNHDGSQGFAVTTHFNRHPAVQKKMDQSGQYMPEPDSETVGCSDGNEMADHVLGRFGQKYDAGKGGEDDED